MNEQRSDTERSLSITLDYTAITRSVSTIRQCETRASDYVIASTDDDDDDDDDDVVFIVVDASRRVFIDRVVVVVEIVVEIVNQSGALFRIASAPPIEDYDLDCVRVRICVFGFVVFRIVVVEPAGRWDEKKNEGPIAVETTGGTNATEGEGGRLRE